MAANWPARRVCAAALAASLAIPSIPALAQSLSYAPVDHMGAVQPQIVSQPNRPDAGAASDALAAAFRRQIVSYPTWEGAGTVIIDTAHTFLYLTLGGGKAIRYGIGVGRDGFTWSGVETISHKSEWPDWIPPAEMIARQPYLPRWVAGGPGNPLGARALYLGNSAYRIHGTNNPNSIGQHVSSGCIRLRNEDVIDLYDRVGLGTTVIVLPNDQRRASSGDRRISIVERAGQMAARVAITPISIARTQPPDRWNHALAPFGLY